ncbi:MAG: hypothetical protein WDZ47_00995 [Bacteroidales bacterium]
MSKGLGKRQIEILQIMAEIDQTYDSQWIYLPLVYQKIKKKLYPEIKYNSTRPYNNDYWDQGNYNRQNVARVTISNAVKSLVKRGYIKHEKRKRMWSFDKIYLTDQGKEYVLNLNSTDTTINTSNSRAMKRTKFKIIQDELDNTSNESQIKEKRHKTTADEAERTSKLMKQVRQEKELISLANKINKEYSIELRRFFVPRIKT